MGQLDIVNYSHRTGGAWSSPASEPNSSITGIGPYDGNSGFTTIVRIRLPKLVDQKRKKLTVKLNFVCNGLFHPPVPGGWNQDTFYAKLTKEYYPENPERGPSNIIGEDESQTGVKYDSSGECSWTFNTSSLGKKSQIVQVWITSGSNQKNPYGTYQVHGVTASETTVNITPEIESVTTQPIKSEYGDTYYKIQDNISFSWIQGTDRGRSEVIGYEYYFRIGLEPTLEVNDYKQKVEGSTSTSANFQYTFKEEDRGKAIYGGVKALGSIVGSDGSLVCGVVGYINQLPESPVITSDSLANPTVDSNKNITYTVTANLQDKDRQKNSIWYQINDSSWKQIATSQTSSEIQGTIKVQVNTAGVKAGANIFRVKTQDEVGESSEFKESSFQANVAPTLSNVNTTFVTTTVKGYAKSATISFDSTGLSTSKVILSVMHETNGIVSNWIPIPPSEPTWSYDYKNRKIYVDVSRCPYIYAKSGGKLSQFKFAVEIQDDNGKSPRIVSEQKGQKSPGPSVLTPTVNTDKINSSAKVGYFRRKLTVSHGKITDATIEKIEIGIKSQHADEWTYRRCQWNKDGGFNDELFLGDLVNENEEVGIKLKITDEANVSVDSGVQTFTRSNTIYFPSSSVNSVNPTIIKPLSLSGNVEVSNAQAVSFGTTTIAYTYFLQLSSVQSLTTTITIDKGTSTVSAKISNDEFLKQAQAACENYNTVYAGKIKVRASDGFGEYASIDIPVTVDFRESPKFNSSIFKIGHDYDIGHTTVSDFMTTSPSKDLSNSINLASNKTMYNAYEGVILALPKVTDLNKDVEKYEIIFEQKPQDGTDSIPTFDFSNRKVITIKYNDLKIEDLNYYYYRYQMPVLQQNYYFKFKVKAIDSTGLFTEEKISTVTILGCRTMPPKNEMTINQITQGNQKVPYRDGTNVKFHLGCKITDLGGSAYSQDGKIISNYGNYKNFERIITGFTKKIILKVDICPDQNFKTGTLTKVISSSDNNYASFKCDQDITFTGFKEEKEAPKFFVRAQVILSYSTDSSESGLVINGASYFGKQAILYGEPTLFGIFGSVPTVSHRSHHVGINTNIFADNDAFRIESYQNRVMVTLHGDGANKGSTITINLSTGAIEGATISGGTW